MKSRRWFVAPLGLFVFVAGCDASVVIEDNPFSGYCSGKSEGTPVPDHIEGDCADLVCDGEGNAKQVPSPGDGDDNNPCTTDSCNGLTPVHANEVQVPCYTGFAGTNGVGVCKGGIQQCDVEGKPAGTCNGDAIDTSP